MPKKTKDNSLFALLFSDLMMGAMGVIIVLLVFLQIVSIRGQGKHVSAETINLPPNLRDTKAKPLIRLRLYGCSGNMIENIKLELTKGREPSHESSSKIGNCHYRHWLFRSGLGESTVSLRSQIDEPEHKASYLSITVGGFIKTITIKNSILKNQIIAQAKLKRSEILYQPDH